MKKFKLTQIIACSLIAGLVLALNPIKANAEWKQDDSGWWYEENDSYSTGWKNIDNKWYYFNSDGYMEHDTVIDGCKLGSDGAWIQETVIATIGEEKITEEDLDKEMKSEDTYLKKQYGNDYATNSSIKNEIKEYKLEALENLINTKVILKEAEVLNIKPSDDEINKNIASIVSQYTKQGKWDKLLKQNNITEAEAKEYFKNKIIIESVKDNLAKSISVTDDEIQAYYNKYKDTKFTVGAGATASHILVADEATAKGLKAKLDAGADFATLAKENSIDSGSKANGGNLGFISYNSTEYIQEFMDAFKMLKEGQVSDPVKSEYGYHLIKATGLKDAQVVALDDVKDKIKSALLNGKVGTALEGKINEWRTDLKVQIYNDKV